MATRKTKRSKAGAWRSLHLQMIAFSDRPANVIDQTWFRDLTGQAPQESVKRVFERSDKGPYRDAELTITADVMRIIFSITPKQGQVPPQGEEFERLPT